MFKRDIGGNIDARFEPNQIHLNGDKRQRGSNAHFIAKQTVRKPVLTFKTPNEKTALSTQQLLSDPTIGESEVRHRTGFEPDRFRLSMQFLKNKTRPRMH